MKPVEQHTCRSPATPWRCARAKVPTRPHTLDHMQDRHQHFITEHTHTHIRSSMSCGHIFDLSPAVFPLRSTFTMSTSLSDLLGISLCAPCLHWMIERFSSLAMHACTVVVCCKIRANVCGVLFLCTHFCHSEAHFVSNCVSVSTMRRL